VQNLIFAGLKNLFNSQDELNFDKFSLTVLESLMEVLQCVTKRKRSNVGSMLCDK